MVVIQIVWKALYMAMQYVPAEKKDDIRKRICEGCKYDDGKEQLACCYCQEGSLFEQNENVKLPRGNRRKLQIIEQEHAGCSEKLRLDCNMDCQVCICRDCEDRYDCDGGNPVTGCGN